MPEEHATLEIYRGHDKHKRRPVQGVKGTYCPEWTHVANGVSVGTDMNNHAWDMTRACELLGTSVSDIATRHRFTTGGGVAFEVRPSGDGSFHGYPVPWDRVPYYLHKAWREEKRVTKQQIRTYSEVGDNIDWAMDSDDAG